MENSILDRLSAHRLLVGAPPDQVAWLAAHGRLIHLEPGDVLSVKGKPVLGLYIMLSGHMSIHIDRGAGPHKVMEWRGGDVGGVLPYSRLVAPPGDVKVEVPTEIFMIPREDLPARELHVAGRTRTRLRRMRVTFRLTCMNEYGGATCSLTT